MHFVTTITDHKCLDMLMKSESTPSSVTHSAQHPVDRRNRHILLPSCFHRFLRVAKWVLSPCLTPRHWRTSPRLHLQCIAAGTITSGSAFRSDHHMLRDCGLLASILRLLAAFSSDPQNRRYFCHSSIMNRIDALVTRHGT